MAIRKQPLQHNKQEEKVNEIIQKGGSSINQYISSQDPYRLTLRIPLPLKTQVEELLSSDPTQPSLTAWILEAMKQRLNRERQDEKL